MKKLLILLCMLLLLSVSSSVVAQVLPAFNRGYMLDTADTVYITADSLWGLAGDTAYTTLPIGASPRGYTIWNWTSGETLLINEEGVVPTLSYAPWATNAIPLIGPGSYVSVPHWVGMLCLIVPSDSCWTSIRIPYSP